MLVSTVISAVSVSALSRSPRCNGWRGVNRQRGRGQSGARWRKVPRPGISPSAACASGGEVARSSRAVSRGPKDASAGFEKTRLWGMESGTRQATSLGLRWVHMRSERCVRACRPVRAVCGGMAGAQPTATRPAGSIRCSPIQHQRRHSRLSAPNELAMQLCGTALILLHPYQLSPQLRRQPRRTPSPRPALA